MEMDWLKQYLDKSTSVKVGASITTYIDEGGEQDPDAFLEWLKENDVITKGQLAAAHANQPVMASTADDPPIETARITKLGVVGAGGMASIHVARDEHLRRKVAYKVMAKRISNNTSMTRRFLAEAQITAQLEHPNIVPIYTIEPEQDSGALAYSMKLIDGVTLEDLMSASSGARASAEGAPGELQLSTLLEHFLKCCDAIAYAHGKGVLHRDLKPANIMIGPHHEVYVMDWGLAKVIHQADTAETVDIGGDDALATRVGSILGTPAYMAPEQARGDTAVIGAHSDQYALGLILFEMVTCSPARPRLDGSQVVAFAREGLLPDITPLATERVDPSMAAIITMATQTSPLERYPSVTELAEDVRRYLANEPVHARPDTRMAVVQRWMSKHREATFRILVGLVGLVCLSIAAGAVKVHLDGVQAELHAEQLGGFLTEMGQVAAAIDDHFSRIEGQVEGVTSGARNLLLHGQPSDEPLYRPRHFARALVRPPDVMESSSQGYPISTHWPDTSVHGGLTWEEAEPTLKTLAPIRHELRRAFLAPRRDEAGIDEAELDRRWRDEIGPVRFALIGLASGVLMELPGNAWDTTGYDPRSRPWYTLGERPAGPHWGHPFREMGTGTLLMPCSMGIRERDGSLLGVTSVMTSFDFLIMQFMALEHLPNVRESYLLDPEGKIMVRSTELASRGNDAIDVEHAQPLFHRPEALSLMAERSAGHLETDGVLIAWFELHMAGWKFVVEAEPL